MGEHKSSREKAWGEGEGGKPGMGKNLATYGILHSHFFFRLVQDIPQSNVLGDTERIKRACQLSSQKDKQPGKLPNEDTN